MEFFKHLEKLSPDEKQAFRKMVIKVCLIEPPTWYTWIRRKKIPKQSQILISNELQTPREILFPEN